MITATAIRGKRARVAALLVSVALLLSAAALSAAETPTLKNLNDQLTDTGKAAGFQQTTDENRIFELIGEYVLAINTIIGVVITAYIIYAGWLWITAEGKEEKIDQAKRILRGAVIALLVVFAAAMITSFLLIPMFTGDWRYIP